MVRGAGEERIDEVALAVTTNARFAARWSPIVEAVTSADTPTEQKLRSHGWQHRDRLGQPCEPVQRAVLLAGKRCRMAGPKRSVRPAEPKSIEPPVHTADGWPPSRAT